MPETQRRRRDDRWDAYVGPFSWISGGDPPRAFADFAAAATAFPALTFAPRGRGEPVFVLPGLGASDASTAALRWFLTTLGYRAYGWELGRNRGPRPDIIEGLDERLRTIADDSMQPVHVIGWSMGGMFAGWLAATHPQSVASVITLGSPHGLRRRFPRAEFAGDVSASAEHPLAFELREPPASVPVTSIYSRSDGVVPWRACLLQPGERRENIEVLGSHFGYGFNPAVMWAIADRLAQRDGTWAPFRGAGWPMGRLFPSEVSEKSA